jgi:H+/Cl- antiporter ClcA
MYVTLIYIGAAAIVFHLGYFLGLGVYGGGNLRRQARRYDVERVFHTSRALYMIILIMSVSAILALEVYGLKYHILDKKGDYQWLNFWIDIGNGVIIAALGIFAAWGVSKVEYAQTLKSGGLYKKLVMGTKKGFRKAASRGLDVDRYVERLQSRLGI